MKMGNMGRDSATFVRSALVAVAGFLVAEAGAQGVSHAVTYFPSASDALGREGFARIINHSAEAGEVSIEAFDDDGASYGPLTLSIGASKTVHFNSGDLEDGNVGKGLAGSTGPGRGDWRLELDSDLDIEALSYIRTADGFLTAMHEVVPALDGVHRVAIFNPGSNENQRSLLRLANLGDSVGRFKITGIDDTGRAGDIAFVEIPPGASQTYTAAELESGGAPGLTGRIGNGSGKWRLAVEGGARPDGTGGLVPRQPVVAMSLLSSPTGHLTNLSTAPYNAIDGVHAVPLFPSASDARGRQGFVRVINRSQSAGEVSVTAFDDADRSYGTVKLAIGPGEAKHFNSIDLEGGNPDKGLAGSTGSGLGDWRLELSSDLNIEVLSYIRTPDGFLTAIHDAAPRSGTRHRLPVFNPGSNLNQESLLRVVNAGNEPAEVAITGRDDEGRSPGTEVRLTVPAGSSRTLSALELETGGEGLEGALGDGHGKWSLNVDSEESIIVLSLLSSPTGHLTNLSTAPPRIVDLTERMQVYNDNVVVLQISENIIRDDGAGGGPHPITFTFNLPIDEYARQFYGVFDDAFDFLMFFANVDESVSGRGSFNTFRLVRNEIQGIGVRRFFTRGVGSSYHNDRYPTERLQGVIYFSANHIEGRLHKLPYGPSLHEIMHRWANYLVGPAEAHWGFSSANGQLGGFDNATLQDLGDGRYAADFSIGGTSRAYSPIELYLAGYLPPEEVPDLLVAEDAEWVTQEGRIAETSEGYQMFTVERWRTYTIDDIVALDGPRVPAWNESQHHFRAAVVLLTDDDHPATWAQLRGLSANVARFSQRGRDDIEGHHNYYEATRGLGSITMDDLLAVRKTGTETPPKVNSITIDDDEIYKDSDFANFGTSVDPALPTEWVVSGSDVRLDGVRVYADGSVRPDIDPNNAVVDSDVRYVFTFKWENEVLDVVHVGNIVDVRFTPSNAAAVTAFFDLLVNDTVGGVTLSDDASIDPTPNP